MKAEKEILDFTIDLAQRTGDVLLSYFGGKLTRTIKSHPEDFVTEADVAAEKLLVTAIKDQFPDDAIVAEESGQHGGTSGYTWIVDPLDGTRTFANGGDIWGTMIARARGDALLLAVVYSPLDTTMAFAQAGAGAYVNEKRIIFQSSLALSQIEPIIKSLPPGPLSKRAQLLRDRLYTAGIPLGRGMKGGPGLAGLLSPYDLRISTPPGKIWDHAPIALLLAEAELVVTNFTGEPYVWHRDVDGFLAASPVLHGRILELLQG